MNTHYPLAASAATKIVSRKKKIQKAKTRAGKDLFSFYFPPLKYLRPSVLLLPGQAIWSRIDET